MIENKYICRDIWRFDLPRFGLWFASLAMVMASAPAAFAAPSGIMPHRAFYEMELGTAGQNANIQAIQGRSAFTLNRDCDGWLSGEDYVIEFGGREGNLDRIVSRFSSWEADAGDKYSFDITETSSYQGNQDFNGYATIAADQADAYFSMTPETALSLPQDTYFPMRHMMAILDHARSGKKILAASVFTGAEPDDALLSTNTVIGSWNSQDQKDLLGGFAADGFWPVRVAYFKPESTSAEPEYEINYALQPNGVIRHYEIDYGEFTIIAKMLKIETVDPPVCQ
jgi:hypothetical protein